MSQHRTINITCPSCDSIVPTVIWRSINVQINPEAKTQLLNGVINSFQCNECGCKAMMPVELFYHDMASRYCIKLLPLYDDEDLDKFTETGQLNVNINLPSGSVPEYFRDTHIVFRIDEMVRYILFRDRLKLRKANAEKKIQDHKGIELLTGLGVSLGIAIGHVRNIDMEDPRREITIMHGDIIVTEGYRIPYGKFPSMDCVTKSVAFITDRGGMSCSAAIIAREMGIPAVTGTLVGSILLKTGQKVIVDGTHGVVYGCNKDDITR
jgi:phosphohistidine swiveling domain-containing protein